MKSRVSTELRKAIQPIRLRQKYTFSTAFASNHFNAAVEATIRIVKIQTHVLFKFSFFSSFNRVIARVVRQKHPSTWSHFQKNKKRCCSKNLFLVLPPNASAETKIHFVGSFKFNYKTCLVERSSKRMCRQVLVSTRTWLFHRGICDVWIKGKLACPKGL